MRQLAKQIKIGLLPWSISGKVKLNMTITERTIDTSDPIACKLVITRQKTVNNRRVSLIPGSLYISVITCLFSEISSVSILVPTLRFSKMGSFWLMLIVSCLEVWI